MATPQYIIYLTSPGVGPAVLASFDPSLTVITLSGADTGVSGSPTFAFDWFDGSVWTTVAAIVNGSEVNSGINVAGSTIHTGIVQGLRPNFTGGWSGTIKVFLAF